MIDVLERVGSVVDAGSNLVQLVTQDRDAAVEVFKDYHIYTAKAVYLWQPERGLRRLDLPHIATPQTEDLRHLLDHIAHSHHFGIYLLEGYGRELEDPQIAEALIQLNHAEWRERHVLVFLDQDSHLHTSLTGQVVRRNVDAVRT